MLFICHANACLSRDDEVSDNIREQGDERDLFLASFIIQHGVGSDMIINIIPRLSFAQNIFLRH